MDQDIQNAGETLSLENQRFLQVWDAAKKIAAAKKDTDLLKKLGYLTNRTAISSVRSGRNYSDALLTKLCDAYPVNKKYVTDNELPIVFEEKQTKNKHNVFISHSGGHIAKESMLHEEDFHEEPENTDRRSLPLVLEVSIKVLGELFRSPEFMIPVNSHRVKVTEASKEDMGGFAMDQAFVLVDRYQKAIA